MRDWQAKGCSGEEWGGAGDTGECTWRRVRGNVDIASEACMLASADVGALEKHVATGRRDNDLGFVERGYNSGTTHVSD